MDLQLIRQINLRKLALACGGPARLADRAGIDLSQLSRMLATPPRKIIGDRIAQKIEHNCGLEPRSLSSLFAALDLPAQLDFDLIDTNPHARQLIATVLAARHTIDGDIATGLTLLLKKLHDPR